MATEFRFAVRVHPYFFMPSDPSVNVQFFLDGESVCPSHGPLKIRNSANSGRKSVCWAPFSVKGPRVVPKGSRTRWRQKIPKKRITIMLQPQINVGM